MSTPACSGRSFGGTSDLHSHPPLIAAPRPFQTPTPALQCTRWEAWDQAMRSGLAVCVPQCSADPRPLHIPRAPSKRKMTGWGLGTETGSGSRSTSNSIKRTSYQLSRVLCWRLGTCRGKTCPARVNKILGKKALLQCGLKGVSARRESEENSPMDTLTV